MNKYELVYDLKEHLDTYSQTYDDYIMSYGEADMIYHYIEEKDKEIESLNKENEKLKNGLNKLLQLNKYMIFFSSKKAISKLIVKQRDLIYELLEGRPRGIMHGSKGVD